MFSSDGLVSLTILTSLCVKTAHYFLMYVYLFPQGDRGEAGPPGKGERGEPGLPGLKVSLILYWKYFVRFTPTNSSFYTKKQNEKLVNELLNKNNVKCTSPECSGNFVFTAVEVQFKWTLVWSTK